MGHWLLKSETYILNNLTNHIWSTVWKWKPLIQKAPRFHPPVAMRPEPVVGHSPPYIPSWSGQGLEFCAISGFHREVDENCVLLGYDAASRGNFLPTFRDNLSGQSSEVKILTPWKWDYSLRNNPTDPSSHLFMSFVSWKL
jgi:hypothetical protein